MNLSVNDVIYRYSTDEAFRTAVQEDPVAVLAAIESLSTEERDILAEVFTRSPSENGFEMARMDGHWFYPIINSLEINA